MHKVFILISFLFCLGVNAQQRMELTPFTYDNKTWGYVDINKWNDHEEWDIVIPVRFEEAGYFQDGFARVKENGRVGYINKSGEFVVIESSVGGDGLAKNVPLTKNECASLLTQNIPERHTVCDLKLADVEYVPYFYDEDSNSLTFLRIRINRKR
jgi:hypothetical protein